MPDSKIQDLTAAGSANDSDVTIVVQNPSSTPVDRKVTIGQIRSGLMTPSSHDSTDHSTALGTASINDLADVTVSSPSSGQVLKWNGSAWANDTDATGGGGGALNDLTDVTITSPATGDVLRYNGTEWVDYADSAYLNRSNHTGTQTASTISDFAEAVDDEVNSVLVAGAGIGKAYDDGANTLTLTATTRAVTTTVAATGSTETLDTSAAEVFDCTMDQNCTFTFGSPASSGTATAFTLILRGAFTPTLPASVDWTSGTAPTYTSPSVYVFLTVDGGTTWLGSQVGRAFA